MEKPIRRILYVAVTQHIPPRDIPYIRGLRELGVEVTEIRDTAPGIWKYFRLFKAVRANTAACDLVWIGYSGHTLAPIVRAATRKPVVFNALSSLYEGIIVSRNRRNTRTLWGAWPWLVDFVGFRCADKVLVETNAQAEYCSKLFFLPRRKFVRAWTGADEHIFHPDPSVQKLPRFTVLFRGAFLPESGIMVLAEAARILKDENIGFRIIGDGMLAPELERFLKNHPLPNMEWMRSRTTGDELRRLMLECHLSLGQLSNHVRLRRTIPHKAFESIAMGLPYLTARNSGILELLREGETCLAFNPGAPDALAKTLARLSRDPQTLDSVARNAYDAFTASLTSTKLARDILSTL